MEEKQYKVTFFSVFGSIAIVIVPIVIYATISRKLLLQSMDSYVIGKYEYSAIFPHYGTYSINDTNTVLGSQLYLYEGHHPTYLLNFNSTSTSPSYLAISQIVNVNNLDSAEVIMNHWPINARFYNLAMKRYKSFYWGYPLYFVDDPHNGDTLVVYYDRVNFAGVFVKDDLIIRDTSSFIYVGKNIPNRDRIYEFLLRLGSK
jgi:hypothetical protein